MHKHRERGRGEALGTRGKSLGKGNPMVNVGGKTQVHFKEKRPRDLASNKNEFKSSSRFSHETKNGATIVDNNTSV